MPFEPDAFQKQAMAWIDKEHSILVSAPTGAGKTFIAEYAIQKAMERNEHVIYTAPIKALSNQKYRDFRTTYGNEKVGILTGDVSLNADAPILIMTTEIYRNSLFENSERIQKIGWVIFDEVHYLDDAERGTVWEEAILFTPPSIRILALSATVPNVHQLADWIRSVHQRPINVVLETKRPVPLNFLFQCQSRIFEDFKSLRRDGFLSRDTWKISPRERHHGMRALHARPNRLEDLIRHLLETKRLPAVYFAFGRRRTESLAFEAAGFEFLTPAEKKEAVHLYDSLLDRYDLKQEKSAEEMRHLVEHGIAYHHAGMLPTLKEVIEQLFTHRMVKLIFTTETFALGINMPARSVIFDELSKFYGMGFKFLTTRDFYQMAGRAGRRGMDERGFVYSRINPSHISFGEIERIIHGQPESIESQLNAAYATLLNLYKELGPKLFEIYPRSFHHFQSSKTGREKGLGVMERKIDLLREMGYLNDADNKLTSKGDFAASVFGYELMLAEMHADGLLEKLNEPELAVMLAGLIFEPRKGDSPPKLGHKHLKMKEQAEHIHRHISRMETKHGVWPHTKPPHFNLALAVEAWSCGRDFDELFKLTMADEGELIRYLRMVIQLLRELASAPHTSDEFRARLFRARDRINRGVVDAEKQLRV